MIETTHRRGKSELGFHKTVYSTTTNSVSNAGATVQNKSEFATVGDYETVGGGAAAGKTVHPGTLLKNFNPRIAPKN